MRLTIAERIRLCRMIEKIEQNGKMAEKLGTKNKSVFLKKNKASK